MRNLFLLLLLLSFIACSENAATEDANTSSDTTTQTTPNNTAAPPPANTVPADRPTYPALPIEKAKELWDKCDYIDYVFFELPYSLSLNKDQDIKGTIRHISASPIQATTPVCKPIGRIFYQHDGENMAEADFYYSPASKCYYLVFLEDNQPKYGNLLTVDAVNYYEQTFSAIRIQDK